MGSRPGERKCLPSGKFAPFPAKQAHSQFCSQNYKGPWRPARNILGLSDRLPFQTGHGKTKTRPARNIECKIIQMNQFGHEIKLLTHVVNYTQRLKCLKKKSSAKIMKIMPLERSSLEILISRFLLRHRCSARWRTAHSRVASGRSP